jgi:hypothetical protein
MIYPIEQEHLWATKRAGVWLGVKAPVEWIVVFRLASWTHGKDLHGCLFTIIRDILYDREARATVGTVNERIVIAPVGRIEQFVQAVVTGRTIGRNECLALVPMFTVCDDEAILVARRYEFCLDRIDARQWWGLFA